jgi:hypothetical protein
MVVGNANENWLRHTRRIESRVFADCYKGGFDFNSFLVNVQNENSAVNYDSKFNNVTSTSNLQDLKNNNGSGKRIGYFDGENGSFSLSRERLASKIGNKIGEARRINSRYSSGYYTDKNCNIYNQEDKKVAFTIDCLITTDPEATESEEYNDRTRYMQISGNINKMDYPVDFDIMRITNKNEEFGVKNVEYTASGTSEQVPYMIKAGDKFLTYFVSSNKLYYGDFGDYSTAQVYTVSDLFPRNGSVPYYNLTVCYPKVMKIINGSLFMFLDFGICITNMSGNIEFIDRLPNTLSNYKNGTSGHILDLFFDNGRYIATYGDSSAGIWSILESTDCRTWSLLTDVVDIYKESDKDTYRYAGSKNVAYENGKYILQIYEYSKDYNYPSHNNVTKSIFVSTTDFVNFEYSIVDNTKNGLNSCKYVNGIYYLCCDSCIYETKDFKNFSVASQGNCLSINKMGSTYLRMSTHSEDYYYPRGYYMTKSYVYNTTNSISYKREHSYETYGYPFGRNYVIDGDKLYAITMNGAYKTIIDMSVLPPLYCYDGQILAKVRNNNSCDCIIDFGEEISFAMGMKIIVYKWSKPYSSVKFTYISPNIKFYFNSDRELKSFTTTEALSYDGSAQLTYGLKTNESRFELYAQEITYGRTSFGKIMSRMDALVAIDNVNVYIQTKTSVEPEFTTIWCGYIYTNNYMTGAKTVTFSMYEHIYKLQSYKYLGNPDIEVTHENNRLIDFIEEFIKDIKFDTGFDLYNQTVPFRNYLLNWPVMRTASYWSELQKICDLSQIYCKQNRSVPNRIEFVGGND